MSYGLYTIKTGSIDINMKPEGVGYMKKRILILALLVICATSITSGTMAYFTAENTAHNVITSNGVDVSIEEWQETEDGLIPYPKEKAIRVMPSTSVSKIVKVKNLATEAYVRANVEIVIKDEAGNEKKLSDNELNSIVSIAINEEEWIRKEGDADWWYYNGSLATDTVSAPLFTQVIFDGPNMTNEYQNCTAEVTVKVQAVQQANNGSGPLEAAGWPQE